MQHLHESVSMVYLVSSLSGVSCNTGGSVHARSPSVNQQHMYRCSLRTCMHACIAAWLLGPAPTGAPFQFEPQHAKHSLTPNFSKAVKLVAMQAARHVRHAVSHAGSPAAAAQAPATDRLPGYSIGKTIGEGGFCKVRMGVHDLSGQQVAIKVIDKLKLKVGLHDKFLPFDVWHWARCAFHQGMRGGSSCSLDGLAMHQKRRAGHVRMFD